MRIEEQRQRKLSFNNKYEKSFVNMREHSLGNIKSIENQEILTFNSESDDVNDKEREIDEQQIDIDNIIFERLRDNGGKMKSLQAWDDGLSGAESGCGLKGFKIKDKMNQ